MKQLFSHTTSQLRTALLFGAITLFNFQPISAQSIVEGMPDAFETRDPTTYLAEMIEGSQNGLYYYIQFFDGDENCMERSYLSDQGGVNAETGKGNSLRTKDYLPFAKNIQWTLETVPEGERVAGVECQFYLKSGLGNYVRLEGNDYICTSNQSDATPLTCYKMPDGSHYEISSAANTTNAMRRSSGNIWEKIINGSHAYQNIDHNMSRCYLRFAKLGDNIAHIIYYQDPVSWDPNAGGRGGKDWFSPRHYLTYSGTDTEGWASVITNGDLEGSDVSCFFTGYGQSAAITDEVGKNGSHGIMIQSIANATNDYDTQFFIRANTTDPIPEGTTFRLEFDYRADKAVDVPTQAHGEPSHYHHWTAFDETGRGNVNFTTEWQHYTVDVTVTNNMVTGNNDTDGFRTIAFNLARPTGGDNPVSHAGESVTYYFDNIEFSIPDGRFRTADISSRSSVMDTYASWSFLTAAHYHQDGLWTLVPEGDLTEGKTFSVKKYNGSDNEYLTLTYDYPWPDVRGYQQLGNQSNRAVLRLADHNASRFSYFYNTSTNYYVNYTEGDGWYVLDMPGRDQDNNVIPNRWQAGFLPVAVPAQDNFYRVLLGVKRDRRADNRIKLTRESDSQGSVTVEPLEGSTTTDLYGATFTVTSNSPTNVFQIKNLTKGCYTGITIEFGSPIPEGYNIHTYGDTWNFSALPVGQTSYTIDLSSGGSTIDDFTIFTLSQPSSPIVISACYFTPAGLEPDCGINEMLNYNGNTSPYSEQAGKRILWELEQDGDYQHFRLKAPDGRYYQSEGQMTNDANQAAVFTNESLFDYFDVKWFYLDPALMQKEIDVSEREIIHKESYLRKYTEGYTNLDLGKQGLASDKDSDWKAGDGTQKTNHFEITHYIKRGNSYDVEFPTVLGSINDHRYYQRFFNYDNEYELTRLKDHINLDVDGNVQYYLYKNGLVTGEKIYWEESTSLRHSVQHRFQFTNTDGQSLTVAADVSRYSDYEYKNSSSPLDDNLVEPSLTMRYIYYMKDAKEMAEKLTACTAGSDNWLETKEFHFPSKQPFYENEKWVGYRGEFIGLRHVFSDYWVFDGTHDDAHLVSAVNETNDGGRIVVEIEEEDPNNKTGIRLGGWNPVLAATATNPEDPNPDYPGLKRLDTEGNDADYQGFYFYDKMYGKTSYGDSRFIVFRYPASGEVTNTDKKAYINVYFKVNETTKYQLARYTLIFVPGTELLPWTSVNGSGQVKGHTERDPRNLVKKAGKPIAKVTFDYPAGVTYHYPGTGKSIHDQTERDPDGTIENSSPVPLDFDHTNYSFDGDRCNWGSYAIESTMPTHFGNIKTTLPANHNSEYGYGLKMDGSTTPEERLLPDDGLQNGFLYIDASEQPGDICAADFQGEFCSEDQLMCSGWISGSNKIRNDNRCPGGITLTIKGEDANGNSEPIYRFCPGQCYELDNGTTNADGSDGDHVVWQQFYFKFSTDKKYERYWMEVNNNCVSSNGGDFMLDNIEVYAIVPEIDPEMNTPLCVKKDGTTEMRLLKLNVDYNKLMSSLPEEETNPHLGFVFLDKVKFLTTFKTKIGYTGTIEKLAEDIQTGKYDNVLGSNQDYKDAFDAALLGNKTIWKSENAANNMGSGVMYFKWSKTFENNELMPVYSFEDAINKNHATYRYTDEDGEPFLILNGNYPQLPWKTETDYYIVPTNDMINDDLSDLYTTFNICSQCSKASTFRLEPPYTVLGLEKSEGTEDYVVCEGQIPTVALNLKGYDLTGNPVDMKGLNFDWWLGNNTASTAAEKLATLENYHKQHKEITYEDAEGSHTVDVKLDKALAAFRSYYPSITSLDGVIQHLDDTPELSLPEVLYLQEVVRAGQLVLHQSSISVPAEKTSDDDPYFYLVACPIHDEAFDQALNPAANEYVSYFCDEPQGLRIKVGQKAPTLKTGFVPGEHGFNTYDYAFPEGTNPVLSIRLAKAAQFETVKNVAEEVTAVSTTVNYLWLPIRNAVTQGAPGVLTKANDDNIYLASSNDPTWDKKISKQMSKTGSLPIVGRIVQLVASNTSGQTEEYLKTSTTLQANNRLSVYFTKGFEVREGYNYTLSLPFQEDDGSNSCDGTILINLKIVPDYEVWTGGAGNTDWNNDENWRRADGNTTINNDYYGDELYIANGAKDDENSPLHGYTTNKDNYYSSSKKANAKPSSDQVLRKGFAPLYCTHVLMKSDEWGNAPVLYDAIDGHDVITQTGSRLINAPFPNLRDTSTPILKFDMQARRYDMWKDTYGVDPDRGESTRTNDLIAEMYQINSCDEIAMQPGTELLNAQLLNYNSAWMEFELETKRWYLLGSPLQGTISGEWYAPTGNLPQQKTTYYDNVTFGSGYDRYSPAIYQRSWDKAKAVLYEVGSSYSTSDDSQTENLGNEHQGVWTNGGTNQNPVWQWQTPNGGADEYLDRLGYKPMVGGDGVNVHKANVAIRGIWSNTYNDAQVDYATGGFSVMVMNHLKGNAADVKAIVRLPKEDTFYDYYRFSEDGSDDGGTDTNISDVQTKDRADNTKRATNRGRLKTDLLLPTQSGIQKQEKEATTYKYVDRRTITHIPIKEADLNTMNGGTFSFTEKVAAGASNLVYYLVENPFPCGLDMTAFFANDNNSNLLEKKYWILTRGDDQNPRQQLVQQAGGEWVTSDGTPGKWVTSGEDPIEYQNPEGGDNLKFYPNAVVAPGQGFFVQAKTANAEGITVTFTKAMQVQSRFGVIDGNSTTFKVVVGQAQKMEELKDDQGHVVYIEIDLDGDGIYGEDIDLDGDGVLGETYTKQVTEYGETVTKTVIEKEVEIVMVPVYQKDGDNYVLDNEGNKIPVLYDIEEDVLIYKYKQEELTQTARKEYPLKSRTRGEDAEVILPGLVITAQRGNDQSSALVMQHEKASNDFLPEEDTETFITSDFENVPTVYTLCGRLATTINSIHDFRCLPIGVESSCDAPCTLTFKGVETLGDSIAFYDAVEQKLTPLKSGMTVSVSGQTQNRYYLVRSLDQKEAAEETHLQIFTEGLMAKVIVSTAEPITSVRCYDTAGRLIHSATPQTSEYSFTLPTAGIYIINAETENDRKTVKLMVK